MEICNKLTGSVSNFLYKQNRGFSPDVPGGFQEGLRLGYISGHSSVCEQKDLSSTHKRDME